MKDINKLIEKVSKRNLVSDVEMNFQFKGKNYKFTLFRHKEDWQALSDKEEK